MMSDTFDPYYIWLGIPPKDQPANHYRLLGLQDFEENTEVIDAAANRQMTYLRSMATGPHRRESQRLLNEIAGARRCLLSPERKQEYDERLQMERSVTDSTQLPEPSMPFIDTGGTPNTDYAAGASPEFVSQADSVSPGTKPRGVKTRRRVSSRTSERISVPSPAATRSDLTEKKPISLQWIMTGGSVAVVAIIVLVILNRSGPEKNAPESTSTTTKLDGTGAAVVTKTTSGRGKKSSKDASQNPSQDDDGRSLFQFAPDTVVIDTEEPNTGRK